MALETTTPPIFTGSTLATGVNAQFVQPVFLYLKLLCLRYQAENLCAIAHLGELEVNPVYLVNLSYLLYKLIRQHHNLGQTFYSQIFYEN